MRRMNGEEVGDDDYNALSLQVTTAESINRESLTRKGKLNRCGGDE